MRPSIFSRRHFYLRGIRSINNLDVSDAVSSLPDEEYKASFRVSWAMCNRTDEDQYKVWAPE